MGEHQLNIYQLSVLIVGNSWIQHQNWWNGSNFSCVIAVLGDTFLSYTTLAVWTHDVNIFINDTDAQLRKKLQ